jgi:hypothetical protein
MSEKELREILTHFSRRSIARFCTEPRTFEEVISHMMEKAGWSYNLAYVFVAEHLGVLEKEKAVKPVEGKWATTEAATEVLAKYF